MSSYIPVHMDRRVRQRANNRCEYCHLSQRWQEATFHVDHVRPKSKGGRTALGNLALACVSCSLRKAARIVARDPKTGTSVNLLNPRRDEWEAHLQMTLTFRMRGLTSTGRATVQSLGMNRAAMVAIRRELSAMGEW